MHLEHFPDGIAGIARAKYELIQALPPDGVAFLNCDDEHVAWFGAGMGERAVTYGTDECAEVRAVQIAEIAAKGVVFTVIAHGERCSVQLRLLGARAVCVAGCRWRSARRRWPNCAPATSAARSPHGAAQP